MAKQQKPAPPPCPAGLSERSAALWDRLADRCVAAARAELFELALRALDRADECKATLDADGLTTKTLGSGTVHVHPLVSVESSARREFVNGLHRLNLDYTPHHIQATEL